MALTPTRETAQTTQSRRGSVLDAVRLLLGSLCGAGRRLSLWKTGQPPGLSHVRSRSAARGRVPKPTGRGIPGSTGGIDAHASEALR
jgi:hypothetical protein